MEELTSVHKAMQNAVLVTKPAETKDEHIIVRVEARVKTHVAQICEQNGVSVSEFLRQCCQGLIDDYTGDPDQG